MLTVKQPSCNKQGSRNVLSLRIGQNVNTLWNNPIQVCIAYFNKMVGGAV